MYEGSTYGFPQLEGEGDSRWAILASVLGRLETAISGRDGAVDRAAESSSVA